MKMKKTGYSKHVREGWTVQGFIRWTAAVRCDDHG